MLEVKGLRKVYRSGSREVEALRDLTFTVDNGDLVCLVGPSGCGKTTLLRCIAGLEHPSEGSIRIGDREVASGRGVPAERRRVGMVFQDGALFPHRTVIKNVNYGIRRGPRRDDEARQSLRLVGLDQKQDRMPGTLSGGEQQRVALARALAAEPAVVLLDEPFSNLDAALRIQLRGEVRRLLGDIAVTAILVTHDQEEAMSFGDHVAVMNAGSIEQAGTAEEIYTTPATPWVARFVGEAVIVPADLRGAVALTALGAIAIRISASGPGTVLLRPEQISLRAGGEATVVAVQYFGSETRYEVLVPGLAGPVVSRRHGTPQHGRGDRVTVDVADVPAHVWPGELPEEREERGDSPVVR